MTPSQDQVEFATRAFLAKLRRLWAREFPDRPCPVLDYEDLNGRGLTMLHGAMRSALAVTDPAVIARLKARKDTQ